jgi:nitrogen fixation NifU-like protein
MVTEDLSKEIILDHYQNPRNQGRVADPTLANRGYNPLCGDEVELSMSVAPDGQHIQDIAFSSRGCSISQASASMMTEAVKGHTLDEVDQAIHGFSEKMASRSPAPADLDEELDALQGVKKYPARVKCALLPWTTLREMVDVYRKNTSSSTSSSS